MKRAAIFAASLLVLLTFAWSAPSVSLRTSLTQTGRPPAAPVLSPVEGPVLSPVEGPVRTLVKVRSEGYDLSWFTVAGTTASESDTYSVMGTVGQPDVGPMTNGDGVHAVYSGFWPATDLPISIYLPVVRR